MFMSDLLKSDMANQCQPQHKKLMLGLMSLNGGHSLKVLLWKGVA